MRVALTPMPPAICNQSYGLALSVGIQRTARSGGIFHATGDGLNDKPQTNNPQRALTHIRSEKMFQLPFVPLPLPDVGFGLVQPARGGENLQPG